MSPLHRHGRDTETDKQQAMSFLSGIPSALHSQRLDGRRMHRVWKAEKGFTRLRSGWAVPDSRACLLVSPGGFCFSLLYLSYSFYIDRIASPHGCMEGNRLNIALASSHNSVTVVRISSGFPPPLRPSSSVNWVRHAVLPWLCSAGREGPSSISNRPCRWYHGTHSPAIDHRLFLQRGAAPVQPGRDRRDEMPIIPELDTHPARHGAGGIATRGRGMASLPCFLRPPQNLAGREQDATGRYNDASQTPSSSRLDVVRSDPQPRPTRRISITAGTPVPRYPSIMQTELTSPPPPPLTHTFSPPPPQAPVLPRPPPPEQAHKQAHNTPPPVAPPPSPPPRATAPPHPQASRGHNTPAAAGDRGGPRCRGRGRRGRGGRAQWGRVRVRAVAWVRRGERGVGARKKGVVPGRRGRRGART